MSAKSKRTKSQTFEEKQSHHLKSFFIWFLQRRSCRHGRVVLTDWFHKCMCRDEYWYLAWVWLYQQKSTQWKCFIIIAMVKCIQPATKSAHACMHTRTRTHTRIESQHVSTPDFKRTFLGTLQSSNYSDSLSHWARKRTVVFPSRIFQRAQHQNSKRHLQKKTDEMWGSAIFFLGGGGRGRGDRVTFQNN